MSLYWGASGKAILAFLPENEIEQTLRRESASSVSGEKPPSLRAMVAELREVRERGYAITEGEKLPGARGVAAPVFDAKGVFGCLCLTSPQERMPHASIDSIVKDIMVKSDEISRFLGAVR
jgi:DNA-binding IclR family transcriptional regulator